MNTRRGLAVVALVTASLLLNAKASADDQYCSTIQSDIRSIGDRLDALHAYEAKLPQPPPQADPEDCRLLNETYVYETKIETKAMSCLSSSDFDKIQGAFEKTESAIQTERGLMHCPGGPMPGA
ncbi:MAG TPA: hypothetical protein VGL66_13265 [Caulobacteraceae bacterium]